MFRLIYRSSSGIFYKNTNFLELGCPNMDQYYAVGSCYYLANIALDNIVTCIMIVNTASRSKCGVYKSVTHFLTPM
jgi:hypothetical protein